MEAPANESINKQNEATDVKQPRWFYAVCIIALLWNLLGAFAVGMNLFLTPDQISQLPQAQQDLHATTPLWTILASIVAVIFGTLGCLFLIMKNAISVQILIVSLLALVIQDFGMFVVVDGVALAGIGALIMQALVFIIALALVMLAKKGKREAWLS
jgi:hypothetical protein